MHSEHDDLLEKIARAATGATRPRRPLRKAVAEFADDFGYDLDEEGQPLDDREVGETSRAQEGIRSSEGDGADERGRRRGGRASQEEAAATA